MRLRALVLLSSLLALSSGCSSAPREWPLTIAERAACQSIDMRLERLDQEIAVVASGSPALQNAIVNACVRFRGISQDDEILAKEAASARHLEDVSLVRSGSSWVPR